MIRFGSFQIDPRTWLLTCAGRQVELSPRLVEILAYIVGRGGEIVTKDELLDKFWPDVNVTENTLTRAIADIRKAIDDDPAEPQYLETASRRGYRFVGERPTISDPFQDWVKGRLALDTLDASKLTEAVSAFERATAELPRYAPAHAGLANGYLLQYERTRFGSTPDRGLIVKAMDAARQATTLDPSLGEGWAVLGYLLFSAGQYEEGQAAARRATALEPENWRHHYRLAYGTWGEERLRAVDRTLAIMPTFAPARMLAAMVFVARGTIDRAERETAIGAELQRQNRSAHTPLPAVGFHWLRGMIVASKGDRDGALECFEEEIASAQDHVYGREFAVNAHVAIGFTKLASGDREGAAGAFAEAATHPKSRVGMCAIDGNRQPVDIAVAELTASARHAEAALVAAGAELACGKADAAAAMLDRLLTSAPPGPAGWIIPIDPMLAALRETPAKSALFSKLAARAA
ncbi:MAG TPA: winged helix-turn-helix domain-containing protein [Vicinamibacterales bacterium]